MEEKSENEKRIRALTKLYYSNPKIQQALIDFAKDRETVPRYFEGFGKRPDILQYPSDVDGLIQKGATSFHASEELWNDSLQLSSEINKEQMDKLRKGWDLLIDIDSPYLDLSKIAAKLVIDKLELFGVKNYGLKFSGNKGFHIIVSNNAFPKTFDEKEANKMFPEWPRTITEYLFFLIRREFNSETGKIMSFSKVEKENAKGKLVDCLNCNRPAKSGKSVKFHCPVCNLIIDRKNFKLTKRRLRCLNDDCAGVLEILKEKDYYFCEFCKDSDNDKIQLSSDKHPELFEEIRGEDAGNYGKLDLVLVAPRHLFRMPYSLHEKTSLSSIVIKKEQLDGFTPRDAAPLKVKINDFLPKNNEGEAEKLLKAALLWKKSSEASEEKILKDRYSNKEFEKTDISGVTEEMFPIPIKKLMEGLKDGKKRGLFIFITFLRSINYSPEQINLITREWNKKNEPPLREGYLKSQVDWHLKQKKKILPPNYGNDNFYKDLGLIDKKQAVKNPLVDVMRNLRKSRRQYII